MARTLVTGGTGMIGRYLVKRLIENGEDVVVASLDNEDCVQAELSLES